MFKIKLADLRAIAKGLGYAGEDDDGEAMKAFVIASKRVVKGLNGEAIDWATAEIEPEELTIKTYAMSAPPVNPTDDLGTIVKHAVAEATKGFAPRPAINAATDPNTVVTVKSVEEAIYDAQPVKHFKDFKTADRFRDYFLGTVLGKTAEFGHTTLCQNAQKRWNESPITKAYGSQTQAGGGALTFMEFIPDLIANVLQYGVSRKLAQIWPMSQEQAVIPKMTGIHTLTYPQQNATATQSTGVSYSNVNLNAKTGISIVKLSKQLVQDANILVLDNVMQQLARTVAYTEDQELLTANGEPTLGGCVGAQYKFLGISSTMVAGGAVSGAANSATADSTFGATTMAQLSYMIGRLPSFARQGMVWVCNPTFLGVFDRLGAAQGGVTWGETQQYGYVGRFKGIPIIEANVMVTSAAVTQYTPYLYLGNFKMGSAIGDRFGLELDATDIRYWDDYAIGVRGVIRHDVVVHDVGTSTVAGPIVCLFAS